jgi:hypothetical protein
LPQELAAVMDADTEGGVLDPEVLGLDGAETDIRSAA